MPKCKNDPTKSYKGNEPSPKGLGLCAHAEKEGVIKKGKDKNNWIVKKTINGSKRWIKYNEKKINNHKGYKKYFTHRNYSRPYLVFVGKNDAYVYVQSINDKYINEDDLFENEEYYTKLIGYFKFENIFIGKTILNEMTKFSGGHGKWADGNSILIHISSDKYIFIGSDIYSFKSFSKIKKFYSPIGNNDVPYPYAIDDNNNNYLLIEKMVVENFSSKKLKKYYYDDPYTIYYNINELHRLANQINIYKTNNHFIKSYKIDEFIKSNEFKEILNEFKNYIYSKNVKKKFNEITKKLKIKLYSKDNNILSVYDFIDLIHSQEIKVKKIKSYKLIHKYA